MSTISEQLRQRMYPEADPEAADPVGWVERRLRERLWSKQREIAQSVVEHRYTAVPSAHGTGKSFLAARLAAHWIDTHPVGDAFVVTTAPTGPQLEAVIWREISRAHVAGDLPGRITGGAVPGWKIGAELVAYGRKPQDLVDAEQAAAAFQGIHARYLLVILDEAAGIPPWLWEAVDSLATSRQSRVLAIGNPTDPASQFAKVCLPGSGWNVLPVSAFDTPAFTGERVSTALLDVLVSEHWVEERKRRWGVGSPLYQARVLGEFPEDAEDSLISPTWLKAAQLRDLSKEAEVHSGSRTYGVDVARLGTDETVAYANEAGKIRLAHHANGDDTMRTSGVIGRMLRSHEAARAIIDASGVGGGVFDRLSEQGLPVSAFQGAERAHRPDRFLNRRAEAYWALREDLREGRLDLDPEDEELASQLLTLRWKLNSKGLIQIERKEEMKRRGLPSPDRADAVAMAVAERSSGFPTEPFEQEVGEDPLHDPLWDSYWRVGGDSGQRLS